MFLDVAFKFFVVCGEVNLLFGGYGATRRGGSFVYTCFVDGGIDCVNDVLESILGRFPFNGGH